MKVYLGADHAGFQLKEMVKSWLASFGDINVVDCGNLIYSHTDDYPDFVYKVAKSVAEDKEDKVFGLVFGFSGTGEAIVANRVKGVRACVLYNSGFLLAEGARDGLSMSDRFAHLKLSRLHNDCNVLSIGAGFVDFNFAKSAIEVFLKTPFTGDVRHMRRINKIDSLGEGIEVCSDVTDRVDLIIPAIIPVTGDDIGKFVFDVKDYVKWVQIDVIDGILVPNVRSWPFSEFSDVEENAYSMAYFDVLASGNARLPYSDEIDYEFDLMVKNPEVYIDMFVNVGASRVVVHLAGINDFGALERKMRFLQGEFGVEFGLAVTGGQGADLFDSSEFNFDVFDYFQVMGISSIGKQGQLFNPESIYTIEMLRYEFPSKIVQVDGSVNPKTIHRFYDAGAERFVVGSYIKDALDVKMAIDELVKSI